VEEVSFLLRIPRWGEGGGVAVERGQEQEEGEVVLAKREEADSCANRIVS
jgi:hypothetical protein